MGCLYQITSPSGKSYIGITRKTLLQRWAGHKDGAKGGKRTALHSAIRKYGAEKFHVAALVIADDWELLCAMERRAIATYGTATPTGYNLTIGGEGGLINDAQRAALSAATKAAMRRPEVVAKVNECARRRAANPAWRKIIGDQKRGVSWGQMPEDAKSKISAARSAEWSDPIVRKRRMAGAANRANKNAVQLKCGHCAKDFSRPRWYAQSKAPKNCSRACYFASHRKAS